MKCKDGCCKSGRDRANVQVRDPRGRIRCRASRSATVEINPEEDDARGAGSREGRGSRNSRGRRYERLETLDT